MELLSVLLCHLLVFIPCEGLRISSKLNFDGKSGADADHINRGRNTTGSEDNAECREETQSRSYEAKIPFLLSKNNDRYEIKIPLAVEGEKTTEESNKITFFSGFNLFERSSMATQKTTMRPVPIVKGSLSNIKPDFLIPIPPETTTANPYMKESNIFESFWPDRGVHEHRNEIQRFKPPAPVGKQWILNTTPFLSFPRNVTTPTPTLTTNKLGEPSFWNVFERAGWKPWDSLSWDQNRKNYWTQRKPGWNGLGYNYQHNYPNYYTENGKYPSSQQPVPVPAWNTHHAGGKPMRVGKWIACPPFEVSDGGASARSVIPGCPQYPSSTPSDVEFVKIMPTIAIDDKTSFKDFLGKPEMPLEEPKAVE